MRRRKKCVPMMALCLLLAGCGAAGEGEPTGDADALRQTYREMAGCAMTAEVTCGGAEDVTVFTVRCQYDPAGESTVEVTAPDTVAGIRATVDGETMALVYDGQVFPLGLILAVKSAADT